MQVSWRTGKFFLLSFKVEPYYSDGIAAVALPMNQPITNMDRHLWIEVAEYLLAAVGVVLIAWLIADDLGSPLWGGLTSMRLH